MQPLYGAWGHKITNEKTDNRREDLRKGSFSDGSDFGKISRRCAMLREIVKWIALTLWQGMYIGLWILCGQELAIRIIPRVIE